VRSESKEAGWPQNPVRESLHQAASPTSQLRQSARTPSHFARYALSWLVGPSSVTTRLAALVAMMDESLPPSHFISAFGLIRDWQADSGTAPLAPLVRPFRTGRLDYPAGVSPLSFWIAAALGPKSVA
jgi:hypothetical protein